MRLLYLHYGSQSGVTAAVARALEAAGVTVRCFDALAGFLYGRHANGWPVPNPRPAVLRAVAEAMLRHGRSWRAYYLHTPFAFDRLTARCAAAVAAEAPDVVLQNGVLFGPGVAGGVPYALYLDHTRAISERYAPLPGLPPPLAFDRAWRARETAVYRGAAAIFTMSEHVHGSLVTDYGVPASRLHVVGAGPNVEPAPEPPGSPSRPPPGPAFLFVGRNWVPKGGPELLDAFARVRRAHPSARLDVVSQHRPRVAPPGVTFHGTLAPAALAPLYAAASAFVLPTLREAFGLSFLEAMRFGLPSIGTRIEAIPELVADGETGLLVPPRDPGALAAAMDRLARDPALAARLGAAGRDRAGRFGWDLCVARMLAVLRPASAGAA